MIKKILVANRGEIAVRVMRTCREMGIATVAVYSDADRNSYHVVYADEAVHIGASASAESYLQIDKIIGAAHETGADAIHPGYGFLSENELFANRCKSEGIIFIGPSPYAIAEMGDKITARKTMIAAGVPVVPGTTEQIINIDEALKIIAQIGLPVMIKASAGGGGKGMRLVYKEEDIIPMLNTAKSEAKAAFGNDAVYIEKYIESPHHIEFQILADNFGNTVHLFERECSVQRRHQKVIEETPSPLLTEKVRNEMGQTAVAAAKAVNYKGAGTIEFVVDNQLNYYFLEMNTRLQVEHPVTEFITGLDLVREQINIANGLALSFSQADLKRNGHSIQCRIYAEDAENNFMPSPGTISHLTEPAGFGIRNDGYVYQGYTIPIFYDPLISKLIVWADNRQNAIQRMLRALSEYRISGVKTSIAFLQRIFTTPDFVSGNYNTHFIENNKDTLFEKVECSEILMFAQLIATFSEFESKQNQSIQATPAQNTESEWKKRNKF